VKIVVVMLVIEWNLISDVSERGNFRIRDKVTFKDKKRNA